MSENKQFFVSVNGKQEPVTEEVYLAYYRSKRRERYFERDIKTESAIRDADGNITGYKPAKEDSLERLMDAGEDYTNEFSVEDLAFRSVMADKLHEVLNKLPEKECELIETLFFANGGVGMTVRECADQSGIPFTTIQSRKAKILLTLKKLLRD